MLDYTSPKNRGEDRQKVFIIGGGGETVVKLLLLLTAENSSRMLVSEIAEPCSVVDAVVGVVAVGVFMVVADEDNGEGVVELIG